MKPRWARLAAICVLAACGGGGGSSSFDTPWRSGERVRAVLASSAEGFSTRVGWRDVELDLDCRAGLFPPFCGAVEADAELELEIYSDPACSQPALVLLDSGSQGYASLQRFGEEPRAFRLLEPLFDEYFVADSSGCIPGSGIDAYAAVELTDGDSAYLGAVLQQVDGVVSEIEEYTALDPGPFYQGDDCVASDFEEHYTGGAVPLDAYASVTFSVE